MNDLVGISTPPKPVSVTNVVVPAGIAAAGERTARRVLGFLAATIGNLNTGEAHYRAACSLFAWLDLNGITELADFEPLPVSFYTETLQTTAATPTVKKHLAAVPMLFDWLAVGPVLVINPAHAVRGPKHVIKCGKTPLFVAGDTRTLLDPGDEQGQTPGWLEGLSAGLGVFVIYSACRP